MSHNITKHASNPSYTPLFATVKILDIGLTTTYFFVIGLLAAKICDRISFLINDETNIDWETYSFIPYTLNIIGHLFFIGIIAYILRNIIGFIPYPLDGIAGFQHKRLKELNGGAVLLFTIFLFQKNLVSKLHIYAKRFLGLSTSSEVEIDVALE